MIYQDLKVITDQLSQSHTFVFYDSTNANVIADDIAEDEILIILDAPTSVTGALSKVGTFQDVLNITMFFLSNKETEIDDNSTVKDDIQKECLKAAKDFLRLYISKFPYIDTATGRLQSVSYNFQTVEFEFNANMHGVQLDVSLPVVLPFDYCLL